jgi:signal transduction histidine kinase
MMACTPEGHPPREALIDQIAVADPQLKLAQAAEALRKCDEHATTGRLALEVMHDIRNPIEALRNLNYLTGLSADDPEAVRRFARLAEEQMAIVSGIANGVLAFAQVANQPKPVNLVLLAEAALRIHQRAIDAKKVRLLKDLEEEAVALVYTSEMLQVISNLIHNALDALPQDGILCLRLRKAEGEIHLLIADNGHGIPAEYAAEVFQPFFTTKEDRGTGLGLSLTKRIVERHRGTIKMRSSVRPGKSGTLFKISLPI